MQISKKRLCSGILAALMIFSQLTPVVANADELFSETESSYVEKEIDKKDVTDTSTTDDATKTTPDAPAFSTGVDGEKPETTTSETVDSVEKDTTIIENEKDSEQTTSSESNTEDETVQKDNAVDAETGKPLEDFFTNVEDKSFNKASSPETSTSGVVVLDATTMGSIVGGGTKYGSVTFTTGSGSGNNEIVIRTNDATRTYGEAFTGAGLTVTLNGTQQSEAAVKKAIAGLNVTMYSNTAQDTRTMAGKDGYTLCVGISSVTYVTINGVNYALKCGDNFTSKAVVNTKTINVKANDAYQNKGEPHPQLTYSVEGLINGDTLVGSLGIESKYDNNVVGQYAVTKGDLRHNNYAINFTSAKLHVVEKALVVSATIDGKGEATRQYGQANPDFSFKISGLTEQDAADYASGKLTVEEILGAVPKVECSADITSAPGDWTVSVTNVGNSYGGYQIAVNPATLHITKRAVDIAVGSGTKVYGDKDPSNSFNMSWGDGSDMAIVEGTANTPIADDGKTGLKAVAFSMKRESGENVGDYGIIGSITDINSFLYYDINIIHGSLKITKAELLLTVSDMESVYGTTRNPEIASITGYKLNDTEKTVFDDAGLNPMFTIKNGTGANGAELKAPVGNYSISAFFNPGPQNYSIKMVEGTLTIQQRPLHVVVASGQNKIYGTPEKSFAVQYTDLGKLEGDFAGCFVSRVAGQNVGEYAYSIEQFMAHGDAKNYDLTLVTTDKFEITKAPLSILVPDVEKVYGNENPTVEVKFDGFINEPTLGIADTSSNALTGALKIEFESTKVSPVGEYDIIASGFASANYTIAYVGSREGTKGALAITPLPVLVKGNTVTRKYGALDDTQKLSFVIRDQVDSKDIAVVDPANSPLNITLTCPEWTNTASKIGTYPVVVGVEHNKNYIVQQVNGSCIISEGDVTIIPNASTFVYGDKAITDINEGLSVTVISNMHGTQQYKDGQEIPDVGIVKITTDAANNGKGTMNAGKYAVKAEIIPLEGAVGSYKVFIADGQERLMIVQRPVSFSVMPGLNKQYGDKDPVFDVSLPSVGTWVGGNNIAHPETDFSNAVLGRVAGEKIGLYAFNQGTIKDQPMAKNYVVSIVNNSFEILPREITGEIEDKTKTYGDVFSENGYSVKWDNFLDKADEDALNKSLSFISAGSVEAANVGKYNIAATFSTDKNYIITLIPGELNVQQKEISATFSDISKEFGDKDPDLSRLYLLAGNISNTGKDVTTLSTGILKGEVTRVAGEDVGDYDILSSLYNSNISLKYIASNKDEAMATGDALKVSSLTISPAKLVIAVNGPTKMTYGETIPEFSVSYEGFKGEDNENSGALVGSLSFINSDTGLAFEEKTSVGTYTVSATGVDASENTLGGKNYTVEFKDNILIVGARSVIARPIQNEKVYGTSDPDFSYIVIDKISNETIENSELAELTVVREEGEDVGDYDMYIEGEDSNYDIDCEKANFEITPVTLTVSIKDAVNKFYGDINPKMGMEDLDIQGLVTNPDLDINDTVASALSDATLSFVFKDADGKLATKETHVGKGSVSASDLLNVGAFNYVFNYEDGDFDIVPRPITITAKDQVSIYGDGSSVSDWTNHDKLNVITFTGDATKEGIVNNDKLQGTNLCAVDEKSYSGEYLITPDFNSADYDISVESGTYTVTPRPLSWSISEHAGVYGDKLEALENSLVYNGGAKKSTIVNGDDLNATITIVDKNGEKEIINMSSSDNASSLIAQNQPTIIREKGEYALVGSYSNKNYAINIVDGKYAIGAIAVDVTVKQGKATYGDIENPEIPVEIKIKNGNGTAVVTPGELGLELQVAHTPFENDKIDGVEDVPNIPSAVKVTLKDENSSNGGIFTTSGIKKAGEYAYILKSDADENYVVALKVVDENGEVATDRTRDFVIERKDVETKLLDMTKLYGEKTIAPTAEQSGFVFGETAESITAPKIAIEIDKDFIDIKGEEGEYKDVFVYVGGAYGDYDYKEAKANLVIGRMDIKEAPEEIITGGIADENGQPIIGTTEDNFSESWSITKIDITAPEGYEISSTDDLEENEWAQSMVINTNGANVESSYFLKNVDTGAITTVGVKQLNIDTVAPVIASADVADTYDSETKTSILNMDFSAFTSAIKVFMTGVDEEKEEIVPLNLDMFRSDNVIIGNSIRNGSVSSGVANLECYAIAKEDASFDTAGNLVIDNSRFENVEMTYTASNSAYASIDVTPDFVGYVVTRTRDTAGQYSNAAVASVSVVAPKAPAQGNTDDTKTTTTAGVYNPQTGVLLILQVLSTIVVIIGLVLIIVDNRKKNKKK